VPEPVIAELAGSRASRLVVRQLSDWMPAGRMSSGRSMKNGVTRCLRDSLLATAGEFAGESRQVIAQLLCPQPAQPGEPEPESGPRASRAAAVDDFREMVERADRYGHLG
jgi:hypothetical protein